MKYPIRVLHILRDLKQGGIQNLLLNLYRNIDRTKVQFDFLVCGDGVFDTEVITLGGKIYKINYLTEVGIKEYEKELIIFFKEHPEYKIIHSHLNEVSGVVMEAAKKAQVPIRIAHSHNTGNNNNFIQKIYKIYLKNKICKNSTNLFACSKEAAQWLFRKNSDKAVIIDNGIDVERFMFSENTRTEIRNLYNIDEGCVILGNVGRLIKQKNQTFLLKIFYYYNKINSNSKLMIVGEGNLKPKIKSQIMKLGLDNKVVLVKPTEQIEKYYNAFDFFVFPSLFEGLGMVLIEAQIAGLKCFASKKVIPKTTQITDNINFIGLDESPQEWAKKIPISNKYNRKNVNFKNNNYDIKKITEKIQKFYLENQEKIEQNSN